MDISIYTNRDTPSVQYYPKADFGFSAYIELERIHELMHNVAKTARVDIEKSVVGSPAWNDAVAWFADKVPRANPFSFINICQELNGDPEYLLKEIKRLVNQRRVEANSVFLGSLRDIEPFSSVVRSVLYDSSSESFSHSAVPVYGLNNKDSYQLLTFIDGSFSGSVPNPFSVRAEENGFFSESDTLDSVLEQHLATFHSLKDNYTAERFDPSWLETKGHILFSFDRDH